MPELYNSQMIIPGPLLDIRKEVVRNESGKLVRQFYTIQAHGKLLAYKGSPNSSGTFWTGSYTPGPPDEQIADVSRLASLRSKMAALNNLFCTQGAWFEVQPFDGTPSIKFQPRIKGITFPQGKWYDTVDYVIDMEAETILFGSVETCGLLSNVVPEETWSIEAADQIGRIYRLTHSISSQQKDLYAADGSIPDGNFGWQRARSIVMPYVGLGHPSNAYGVEVASVAANWGAYNYFWNQNVDEGAGKFAITETWTVYDPTQGTGTIMPPALDDFTVNSRIGEDGIVHVTIDGTVTGLEMSDNVTGAVLQTRWQSAALYFTGFVLPNIFARASSYSGVLLNPIQISSTIGRNPIQGTVSWSAEYTSKRLPVIPGAINEDITIQLDGGTDVFATIPIVGRPWGPALQGIGTISERTMNISISAQLPAATVLFPGVASPNTDGLVLSLAPVALQVFRQRDNVSWSADTGRYSRQTTFVYQ
jgi:hypothetical protein